MKQSGFALLLATLIAVSVAPAFAQSSDASIPSYAHSSGDLASFGNWIWTHDKGTPGSASGTSHYPESNPSLDGKARQFEMSQSGKGGLRYSLTFAHDAEATHFIYDTYVYIDDPAQLANLEMDMNQVIPNGDTVILGFQCSMYSNTWEYSLVSGGGPHWHSSGVGCNPRNWKAYAWHHVQIATHRTGNDVTYDWVSFDGVTHPINRTGLGALPLHWAAGDLILNFQLDGATSRGTINMFADKMMVYYW